MKKIKATILKNQITSNSPEAYSLHNKSHFGEKSSQKILYSPSETLFLIQQNKMQLSNTRNNIISQTDLIKKFARADKNFQTKYQIFKDLRKKGYIVKTALKFGADFRIYKKNSIHTHSKWLCYTTTENKRIKWSDFSAKTRVAHSTKKNLLIAIVDDENKASYYEIKWTQP